MLLTPSNRIFKIFIIISKQVFQGVGVHEHCFTLADGIVVEFFPVKVAACPAKAIKPFRFVRQNVTKYLLVFQSLKII